MWGPKPNFEPVRHPGHKTSGRMVDYKSKNADGNLDLHKLVFSSTSQNYLVVDIIGNNFRPSGFLPGSVAVIDRSIKPKFGEIGAFNIGGELLIRRLVKRDGRMYMVVDDSREPPYEVNKHTEIFAIGKVVRSINFID